MTSIEEVNEITKIFDMELARTHAKRIIMEMELGELMQRERLLKDEKVKLEYFYYHEKKESEEKCQE